MPRPALRWLLFAACLAVFSGAMVWISQRTLDLEDQRCRNEEDAQVQERVRLALWRMDSLASTLLIRENSRPPSHYQTFYSPEDLFSDKNEAIPQGRALMPSPLMGGTPDLVLLHFELVQNDPMICSPQAPVGSQRELVNQWYAINPELAQGSQRLKTLDALLKRHPEVQHWPQVGKDARPGKADEPKALTPAPPPAPVTTQTAGAGTQGLAKMAARPQMPPPIPLPATEEESAGQNLTLNANISPDQQALPNQMGQVDQGRFNYQERQQRSLVVSNALAQEKAEQFKVPPKKLSSTGTLNLEAAKQKSLIAANDKAAPAAPVPAPAAAPAPAVAPKTKSAVTRAGKPQEQPEGAPAGRQNMTARAGAATADAAAAPDAAPPTNGGAAHGGIADDTEVPATAAAGAAVSSAPGPAPAPASAPPAKAVTAPTSSPAVTGNPLEARADRSLSPRAAGAAGAEIATAAPGPPARADGDRENESVEDVARRYRGAMGLSRPATIPEPAASAFSRGGPPTPAVPGQAAAAAAREVPASLAGDLRPTWLEGELLLLRPATLDGRKRIQGVWLDWPTLRQRLLETIRDLLPAAQLIDAGPGVAGTDPSALVTLPVKLLAGAVPVDRSNFGSPLKPALMVAWACLIAAALAVAFVLHRAMVLSERRGAFVSAVTHELRTPLTTFRLYSEMLADDMVPDAAQRRSYLQTLCDEATRLMHLVENVLSYSRIERGRTAARTETVSAGDLLQRSIPRLRQRCEQSKLELVSRCDDNTALVCVQVDVLAVEQILFNLTDNAGKYAAPDSKPAELHVTASSDARQLVFEVRDFGPGISAAQKKKLFQPFAKSATEAAHSAQGVGLGLALCRRLARELGGELVHAEPEGRGACFRLTIPQV